MALNIKNAEADSLARELSALTGETITEAVTKALSERIERTRQGKDLSFDRILAGIQERVRKLPILDPRSDDEIMGYSEYGTFD